MWTLALLAGVLSDPGEVWLGDQEEFVGDMSRSHCDLVQSCPNVPADFSESDWKREQEACVLDMPCYSSSAATGCMTVALNTQSEGYAACVGFGTLPACIRPMQWANWQSEACVTEE